jgi:DNA-binding beta-propeller fold protein YncE
MARLTFARVFGQLPKLKDRPEVPMTFAGCRRLALLLFLPLTAHGQITSQGAAIAPTNDLPNPYRTIENWAQLGRAWGSTSAVDIDPDGRSIWVAERCGVNSCAGSDLPAVFKFDANGKLVTSFGAGMFVSPHGIFVDRGGNVWVVDCACTVRGGGRGADTSAARPAKGHQVFEFSPGGKLLMTLGKPGGGSGAEYFTQPNDVLVAPNGDIFVVEGHSSAPGSTARVLKFSKDGKLIKTWGAFGHGPDDLDQPHALAMDSRGRLFVGDRGNNRIKIFDQDGKLLDTWYQFSRPSGIYIDAHDTIYVADSESGSVAKERTGWKRGIRVGSARDGSVTAFIPDPAESPPSTSAAEGVAADAHGVIYGAEVGPRALKRYVKQ